MTTSFAIDARARLPARVLAAAQESAPTHPLAIQVKRAITVSGAPIDDAVIVIENGRITAIGPRATTDVPEDADVIEAGTLWATPGFVHPAALAMGPSTALRRLGPQQLGRAPRRGRPRAHVAGRADHREGRVHPRERDDLERRIRGAERADQAREEARPPDPPLRRHRLPRARPLHGLRAADEHEDALEGDAREGQEVPRGQGRREGERRRARPASRPESQRVAAGRRLAARVAPRRARGRSEGHADRGPLRVEDAGRCS